MSSLTTKAAHDIIQVMKAAYLDTTLFVLAPPDTKNVKLREQLTQQLIFAIEARFKNGFTYAGMWDDLEQKLDEGSDDD